MDPPRQGQWLVGEVAVKKKSTMVYRTWQHGDGDDVFIYLFFIINMIRIVIRLESINLYKYHYIIGWEDHLDITEVVLS